MIQIMESWMTPDGSPIEFWSGLITGERFYNLFRKARDSYRDYAEYYNRQLVPKMIRDCVDIIPLDGKICGDVRAFVNQGRWLVRCPFCKSSELGWENWNKYLCLNCWNYFKGMFRVIYPINAYEIESILRKRPLLNRNWLPNETFNDLVKENKEHGVN